MNVTSMPCAIVKPLTCGLSCAPKIGKLQVKRSLIRVRRAPITSALPNSFFMFKHESMSSMRKDVVSNSSSNYSGATEDLVGKVTTPYPPNLRRIAWISFWAQLALSIVSSFILFFALSAVQKGGVPNVSVYFALFGVIASFVSTFMAFTFTRLARKAGKAKAFATGVRRSISVNFWGLGATIFGLQASVGTLVAKTLTSTTSNPYAINSQASQSSPVALDIFSVQASTNTILAHFVAIVLSSWLIQIIQKAAPKEAVLA